MKTFQNARVRVTIPDTDYERFLERAGHDEVKARGHILSEAMVKLANAKAAKDLAEAPSFPEEELVRVATNMLVLRHLSEHSHYEIGMLMQRWQGGHIMSAGMQCDINAAHGYAIAQLHGPYRQNWLNEAEKSLKLDHEVELKYRQQRGNWANWQLEIIGAMPSQIGLVSMN